ncbi:MAG TPA: MSMEG_1061 family FMN-dependent PPOX-type flavoprotein [Hydrogenophaga sp.]
MTATHQPITEREALRALYGPVGDRSARKVLPQLDRHATHFVGLSPFVVISSADATTGELDVSPRGGQPGFVKAPDAHTLLIPDAPGNNRLDTLENIVSHGQRGAPVSLLFMVPGVDETLRVNGRAWLSADLADRQRCEEGSRVPKLVVRMAVEHCYLHCAKAFMRARLWDPSAQVERKAVLPSMGEMLRDQLREFHHTEVQAETQEEMVKRYQQTL